MVGLLGISNSIVTGLLPVTLSLFFRESPTAVAQTATPKSDVYMKSVSSSERYY